MCVILEEASFLISFEFILSFQTQVSTRLQQKHRSPDKERQHCMRAKRKKMALVPGVYYYV